MRIDDVRLSTADLPAAVEFYRNVLELPVAVSGDTATAVAGRSTITLAAADAPHEANHIAFTIPSDQFASAREWLEPRVELLTWRDGESELRLGEPWNSESLYFFGPDGIILEFITRARLDNPAGEPFTSHHIVCVSEVGLATVDVPAAFAEVRRAFGVDTFAGESPHFTTAGDQDGLLILVTTGRPWFPRDDVFADTPTVAVTLSDVQPGSLTSAAGWTVTAV
jgi:catechol 2,3-dioxygenase-like lactoylglutathione lyase family enzyme